MDKEFWGKVFYVLLPIAVVALVGAYGYRAFSKNTTEAPAVVPSTQTNSGIMCDNDFTRSKPLCRF